MLFNIVGADMCIPPCMRQLYFTPVNGVHHAQWISHLKLPHVHTGCSWHYAVHQLALHRQQLRGCFRRLRRCKSAIQVNVHVYIHMLGIVSCWHYIKRTSVIHYKNIRDLVVICETDILSSFCCVFWYFGWIICMHGVVPCTAYMSILSE